MGSHVKVLNRSAIANNSPLIKIIDETKNGIYDKGTYYFDTRHFGRHMTPKIGDELYLMYSDLNVVINHPPYHPIQTIIRQHTSEWGYAKHQQLIKFFTPDTLDDIEDRRIVTLHYT